MEVGTGIESGLYKQKPGARPGRGKMETYFGMDEATLRLVIVVAVGVALQPWLRSILRKPEQPGSKDRRAQKAHSFGKRLGQRWAARKQST